MPKTLGAMFGHRMESERSPDPTLPIPLGKVGIEIEVENSPAPENLNYWTYKPDHSLRNNGLEYVTNGPMYGQEITRALQEILPRAKERKWSEGYPRAGIHVHLDVRDLDFEANELSRLVSNYMLIEHAMFAYAGEWRRCTQYCDALEDSQNDFVALGKFLYNPPDNRALLIAASNEFSKYQALNLKPLALLGTVEFRALPTTFDFQRIINWIKVILAIKRSSQDKRIVEPLQLLSTIGPIDYAHRILGETHHILAKFIDPNRIWDAATNATSLMAHGNKFADKEEAALGWDANEAPKPNPIIERLKAAKKSKAASQKAKSALSRRKTL